MTRRDTIYLLELLLLIYLLYVLYKRDNPQGLKVEYTLEIINQDSVKIQSIGSNRTYTVHIDSIQGVLEQDNI
jgi:hypothetical protein